MQFNPGELSVEGEELRAGARRGTDGGRSERKKTKERKGFRTREINEGKNKTRNESGNEKEGEG